MFDQIVGLVPWTKQREFNYNLWLLTTPSLASPKVTQLPADEIIVSNWHIWNQRMWIVVGTVYIVAAIYTSASYLDVAQVNWAFGQDLICLAPTYSKRTGLYALNAPVGSYRLDQPNSK
ncbi:hypothetical protein THRCLA_22064 [Thraustotheca clavata]|uniref:Uncharacterized protein n=1 Tax=Thraustotheca clavata TaxID=74557 RepID=A0A1V9ZDC6_9STRA|nr:hypothetical protein THRCLA_22064 [Thraustotheca clavata]